MADRITREQCDEFMANQSRNPVTNRPIDPNGRVARSLRLRCAELTAAAPPATATSAAATRGTQRPLTQQDCDEFRQNPARNPVTRMTIQPSGTTANRIRRDCDAMFPVPGQAPAPIQRTRRAAAVNATPAVQAQARAEATRSRRRRTNIDVRAAANQPLINDVEYNGVHLNARVIATILYQIGTGADNDALNIRTPNDIMDFIQFLREAGYPDIWLARYAMAGRNGAPMPVFRDPNTASAPAAAQPVQSPSMSNKLKRFSSRSIPVEEVVIKNCNDRFEGITEPPFKSKANKLMRMCHDYMTVCDTERVKTLQRAMQRKRYAMNHMNVAIPDPHKCFSHVFNRHLEGVFKCHIENIRVRFQGQQGIGVGVVRTFAQECINQVRHDKFFAPVHSSSTRHVINPNMTVERARALGYHVQNNEDLGRLYGVIGHLFAFCARFDFPVPIYLARAVSAHILYKETEITPEHYVFYYALDADEDVVNSKVRLLREPNTIEYVFMEGNDDFRLYDTDDEVPITVDNYFDYLHRYSRHMFTRQLIKGAPDTSALLSAFINGFYIRRFLRKEQVTVRELEKLMCGKPITFENIKEWIDDPRVISYYPRSAHEEQILEWFKEILADLGKSMPLEDMQHISPVSDRASREYSRSLNSRQRRKVFTEFFMNLMQFWTSYRKLDSESRHQVTFERDNGLPTAHTCFRQLCLPRDVRSREDLYQRLIIATSNVERGVGLV